MGINKNIKEINSNIKSLNDNITKQVKSVMPLQIQYIVGTYLLGLFFMMMFRIASFAVHCFTTFSDINFILLLRSLLVGVWFDTIVSCVILIPFSIIMTIASIFNINRKWFYRPLHIIIVIAYVIVYFVYGCDVAYFAYFASHINIIALSWIQSFNYIGSTVIKHPVLLLYISAFLVSIAWYLWLMYCLYNTTLFKTIAPYNAKQPLKKSIPVGIFIILLCLAGIHGRITEKKPVDISSAYFCDNDFFNQLGVSGLFNLYKSIQEENQNYEPMLKVVDGITVKKIISGQFINQNDVTPYQISIPYCNIVMIMMDNVENKNISYNRMPYLNNIKNKSLFFNNVYPDGENAYNGIYSTLFAYPNIFSKSSMNSVIVPRLNSLQKTLQQKDYLTLFFSNQYQKNNYTTRFLYLNNFKYIGVDKNINPDKEINKINLYTNKFFACILLNNNNKFKADNDKTIDKQIKYIMALAKKQEWFSNTMFVFVGANGRDKIPFIVYYPGKIKPGINTNLAKQEDIFPTIAKIVDESYTNENILGLNILANQREFAFSSYKDELIVEDSVWRYTWHSNGEEEIVCKINDNKKTSIDKQNNQADYANNQADYLNNQPEKESYQAEKMRKYAFSMLQTTQIRIADIRAKKE